jgi:lauroyl/myristoyl acyltransferase
MGLHDFLVSGFSFLVAGWELRQSLKTENPNPTPVPSSPEGRIAALSRWKRFRYRLEEIGCRFLAGWLPTLSRRRCVKLGLLVGDLAWFADFRGRAIALANLKCVFGDQYTVPQRKWIARLSYRNFAKTMLDLFWAHKLEPGVARRYARDVGFDVVREQGIREKRGLVFMMVHQGNWELANVAAGYNGIKNTVVTENFKNPRLDGIFRELREVSGHTMIPQENSLIRMLKVVKRGGHTGLLIDLGLRPSQAATIIEAFGFKMCVPVLHAVLIQRVNALAIPVETEPFADGTCRVTAYPALEFSPEMTLQEIAQKCWDPFEEMLRRRPDLWLWPYKYFRYRPKDADRPYPFYARESSPFEKLQRTLAKGEK